MLILYIKIKKNDGIIILNYSVIFIILKEAKLKQWHQW